MAVDMLLKIEGVDGESVIRGHEREIDVLAWSWGMSQSGSMHIATGGGSGKVSVQDIALTKRVDKASPVIWQYCCSGKHFPRALLTVRKAGDSPVEYLKIKMEKVLITSMTTGGSGGDDMVMEHIGLNFASFEMKYIPQNPDGSAGAEVTTQWNIAANTPSV
ncbi:MAG: type VI secretion system tube protein Hcp [Syntrophobacter sp.]